MFNHNHHLQIYRILKSLDASFLKRCEAYFGGGTLISLQHGEYRWSKDVDFICPVGEGYRLLRQEVAEKGYGALFQSTDNLSFPRDIQANQYGIRFPVNINGASIKFEIVAEARIKLGDPVFMDWEGVGIPCLNRDDSISEKLLANADRYMDKAVEGRDIIDLSVLRYHEKFNKTAIQKAEKAYPVLPSLFKAVQFFSENPDFREKCFKSLEVEEPWKILDGLDMLAKDLGLPPVERKEVEEAPISDEFVPR